MPSDATSRKSASDQMFGASAQAAVPTEYIPIVRSRVRVRPRRSAMRPKTIPPAAHPISSSDVRMPVQRSVAAAAAGVPMRDPEEHRHARRRDEVEEKAVEDVEAPAKPCREQDHPLRTVHVEYGQARWRGSGNLQINALAGASFRAAPRYHRFLRKSSTPHPW